MGCVLDERVIAIIRGIEQKDIINTVQALYDGGICAVEVALNHSADDSISSSLHMIASIKERFGDQICLGAGTVMDKMEVELAVEAGAEFIISPNINIEVICRTKELGVISMPGALTPSEIEAAYNYGADVVKLFPAGIMGKGYIKAIKGPLADIPLAAVGGVTLENAKELLDAGCQLLGIGSNLVSPSLVSNGAFREITEMAKEYLRSVGENR